VEIDRIAYRPMSLHGLLNTINASFVGQLGAEFLARLEGIAASTGPACRAWRVQLPPGAALDGIAPEVGTGASCFSLGCPKSVTRSTMWWRV
jgi:cysteine desulfurase